MKKCHLCDSIKKLCKAHIINRSAIKRLYTNSNNNKVLLLKPNDPFKKHDLVSDYLYDQNILCSDCDNLYANDESYFMSFVNQRFNQINLHHLSTIEKVVTLVQYENFDHKKFKTALLFILWKASVSNRPGFQNFNLGNDENEIKKIITSDFTANNDAYPFVVYSLKKVNNEFANVITPPFITELEGVKIACFLVLDYIFLCFLTDENVSNFYTEKISTKDFLYIQEWAHVDGEELLMEVLTLNTILSCERLNMHN
jgi:hypothetical protein